MKALDMAWVVAELFSAGLQLRQRAELASLNPCHWGQFSHAYGEGRSGTSSSAIAAIEGQGQMSQGQQRTAMAQPGTQILIDIILMAPRGNIGHGHEHREQIQQYHGPRQGPW